MNRRELLKGLMAGGMIVAGELWIPGQKLISIPSGTVFQHQQFMIHEGNIRWVGGENGTATVLEFYDWVKKFAGDMLDDDWNNDPGNLVSLKGKHRLTNPEHLVEGNLSQHAGDQHMTELREMWTCSSNMGHQDLITDKFYILPTDNPRPRITLTDDGNRGYR